MVIWALLPIVCIMPSCLRFFLALCLCGGRVSANRGSLSVALVVRIVLPSFQSQACSLSLKRFPVVMYCFHAIGSGITVLPFHPLIMVCHCMRSRFCGSHGGHAHSQSVCSVDIPLPPNTLPSSPVNSPPLSPSCRSIPHNAF